MFVELCGISKANSSVDYAMLEYCIREDLKMKRPRMMAVLDPVKVVIDDSAEGETEYLEVVNNLENEALGEPARFRFQERFIMRARTLWRSRRKKYFHMLRAMRSA